MLCIDMTVMCQGCQLKPNKKRTIEDKSLAELRSSASRSLLSIACDFPNKSTLVSIATTSFVISILIMIMIFRVVYVLSRHPTCTGEAEAIYRRADATAKGIAIVSEAVTGPGGSEAAALRVAEQYLNAFSNIAKEGNTLLLPAAANDPAGMVAQAMSIYKTVAAQNRSLPPGCAPR